MNENIVISEEFDLPVLMTKLALACKPKSLDFVLSGLQAGTVGTIISPGGVGKSAFVLNLMKQVSKKGRAVYLSLEDNINLVEHRLHALYNSSTDEEKSLIEDPSKFVILSLETYSVQIETEEWFNKIKKIATNSRIIFIDTLSKSHRSNENDSGEMSYIVSQLSRIANSTGCAIVFVHHTSKQGVSGSQQASRGSSALVDNVRCQYTLEPMSDKEAKVFGISEGNSFKYFKVSVTKVNAGVRPPVKWFEKVSDTDPEIEGFFIREVEFTITSKEAGKSNKNKMEI